MLRAALKRENDQLPSRLPVVSTHTMLRAALKHEPQGRKLCNLGGLDTHNAACGIETADLVLNHINHSCLDTHNAACGIETYFRVVENLVGERVSTHTMLRAALKHLLGGDSFEKLGLDTHNAACGIETSWIHH